MVSRISSIQNIYQFLWKWRGFPYLSLLFWVLPLLLFNSEQQSLMAHDEGLYALRSRRMVDSGDWINPWDNPHHKTPGYYWLVASAFRLFGISEISARLPSIILGVISILLIYEIGKILLSPKIAWLAGVILSVEFLWLQYCRLGTPDIPYIFLVLLAIFALLQGERQSKISYIWGSVFGLCLTLGFLLRSFMILVPFSALFPYLIIEHHRHKHLKNPMIYLGAIVGLIPTLIWVYLSWLHYGEQSWQELFNFAARLSSTERYGNGIGYYLWNVPIKSFPWSLFAIFGSFLVIKSPVKDYKLILVGTPLIILSELTLFSTRLSHYSLSIYPFIALLAAVGLSKLIEIYNLKINDKLKNNKNKNHQFKSSQISRKNQKSLFPLILLDIPALNTKTLNTKALGSKKYSSKYYQLIKILPQALSYIFGILGGILFLASIVVFIWINGDIRNYATLALILGTGWLILPLVWIGRCYYGKKLFSANYWLAAWLVPVWLTLVVAGSIGLLGDYNTDFKNFIQQPSIAQVLANNSVNFLQVGGKTGVLINFYTSLPGRQVTTTAELEDYSYTWIKGNKINNLSQNFRVIGSIKKYKLIQVLPQDK